MRERIAIQRMYERLQPWWMRNYRNTCAASRRGMISHGLTSQHEPRVRSLYAPLKNEYPRSWLNRAVMVRCE